MTTSPRLGFGIGACSIAIRFGPLKTSALIVDTAFALSWKISYELDMVSSFFEALSGSRWQGHRRTVMTGFKLQAELTAFLARQKTEGTRQTQHRHVVGIRNSPDMVQAAPPCFVEQFAEQLHS